MTTMSQPQRIIPILAAALLFTSWLNAQDKLPLEQAIQKALQNNPELTIDAPAREAAGSELAASRAGFLPRLDFDQSLLGGNNPVYVFGTLLSQQRFTEANFSLPSLNQPDALKNLQTRVVAQQNIWDFGRTRERVEAASLGVRMADLGHEDHLRQTLLGVVETYYSVSLSREILEAATAALQSAESIVNQARSRVESGLAVEADLLRSQVYLAAARQQEIQATGQGEVARATLNRIMGEPLDRPVGETDRLARGHYSIPTEEALQAELRKRRPDYLRLESEVHQGEVEVRARKAQLLPTLGAFAAWEADNPSLTRAGGSNWAAGLSLHWNVFAGGGDAALLQAARHRLEQKQRQLKAMESAMALEVHKALVQVRSAEQQVEAMQAAEAQSGESLRILRNRYEAGLATMTDLLSAEAARSAARTALAEAIYRHRVSFAQMEYAAGILGPNSAAMR
ncbi:MAG TPA: TolC family protein [Acidobacteriota bacterium]|nr:TolC family protein [Acidobacteriota bacterium]